MKKFNLYQTTEGIMNGYYIGCIYAETAHKVGNAYIFQIGEQVVATMNFVRVQECIIDED